MIEQFDNPFISIGTIGHAHGIRGEVYLHTDINDDDIIDQAFEEGFLFTNGSEKKVILAEELRPHKKGFLLRSSSIPTRNDAETFKGWKWLFSKSKMVSEESENIFLHEIQGFTVFDSALGIIGNIISFTSNSAQDLILVESNKGKNRTIEIPLVKPFIEKIDFAKKTLLMKLPEGLVE